MESKDQPLQITPETRVGALIEAYPELEETLIEMSPAFSKLRNPLLRKTVAKVATLRQVAKVGGISLEKLINDLRRIVGQSAGTFPDGEGGEQDKGTPEWVSMLKIDKTYDARADIESGLQPMGKVLSDLRKLRANEMYELVTPFAPAPLIDIAKKKGYRTFTRKQSPAVHRTYFALSTQSTS